VETTATRDERRPTARVLLQDAGGRVFLFRYEDPLVVDEPDNPTGTAFFWCTPGGGVWPGESYRDAARRELREETGIVDADLGPCVWTRGKRSVLGGVVTEFHERCYLARVPGDRPAISLDHQEELERGAYRDHRWWHVDEIAASDEIFFPRGLAALLAPIAAGQLPERPLRVR
jgi:8-oxo-dGTP diphosphatase